MTGLSHARSLKWDDLIDECHQHGDSKDAVGRRAAQAMEFLKAELRDGAPDVPLDHFLVPFLVNRAPWTRQYLAWLADALENARASDGYDRLLKGLKHRSTAQERVSVLRASDRLRRVGCRIAFDVPAKTGKVPDFTAWLPDGAGPFEFEVSVVGEGDESKRSQETAFAIYLATDPPGSRLHACGRIFRSLSAPHLREVVGRIREKAVESSRVGDFVELHIPDVLLLGLAPPDRVDALEAWAAARGIRSQSIEGPPIRSDEVARIRGRLRGKQKQLARGKAGVVVLYARPTVVASSETVNELAEELYAFEHVLATVVTSGTLGSAEPSCQKFGVHKHMRVRQHEAMVEDHFVLENRFCKFPDPELMLCLRAAFSLALA